MEKPMVRYDFSGQVAVVTGAASGVGLRAVHALLDANAQVSLWDVNAQQLEVAAAQLARSDRVDFQKVDVRHHDSVDRAAQAAMARWGRIDVLVNNAGIIRPPSPLAESSLPDWDDVIAINLSGVFHCCRAVIPLMAAAGYGRVINVGSTSGKEGNPFTPSYSAAKAGVMALTKSLGKEFAKSGVLVNCISPTVMNTPMTLRNMEIAPARTQALLDKIPMGRFGEPDELVAMLLWLASDACSFSTGAVFDLSGGRATY